MACTHALSSVRVIATALERLCQYITRPPLAKSKLVGREQAPLDPLCPWCVQVTHRISETDLISTT